MKTPVIGAIRGQFGNGPSIYRDAATSRKKRAEKAKKTLAKLLDSDPVLRAAVERKAVGIALSQAKQRPVAKRPTPAYAPGMGSEFYNTREWRELRYQVFVKYGKKCMCCGSVEGYLHVDHILPRSKHPHLELEFGNLQVLCEACNVGKSNRDQTDWRR